MIKLIIEIIIKKIIIIKKSISKKINKIDLLLLDIEKDIDDKKLTKLKNHLVFLNDNIKFFSDSNIEDYDIIKDKIFKLPTKNIKYYLNHNKLSEENEITKSYKDNIFLIYKDNISNSEIKKTLKFNPELLIEICFLISGHNSFEYANSQPLSFKKYFNSLDKIDFSNVNLEGYYKNFHFYVLLYIETQKDI